MRNNGAVTTSPRSTRNVVNAPQTTNLADLLERVLDKGIVIAGDITLFLGSVQLLTLKIRLLIASIDKAQEIGIDWWQLDPALSSRASSRAKDLELVEQERNLLKERLDRLERLLLAPPQEVDQTRSAARQRSNVASGYALDREGRVIAELKPLPEDEQPLTQKRAPQPVQQLHKEEPSHAPEQASQPGAAQAEQLAGAGPLLGPALHERMACAMRPVLEGLRQRNTQDPQPLKQTWPAGQRGEEQPQEAVQNAAPARVLEEEGRIIAELEQLVQPPPQEERPQVLERAEESESEQTEQPAGGGPLLSPTLHERMAQAIQPVLEGLRQRRAQAPQLVEQARLNGQQKI